MRAGRSRGPEAGFTMIATLIGITVMMALALVTVTAVQGDISLTSRDETNKQAYEAAKAGIENYAFHLYSDPLYWSKCTNVPEPNAVNQIGSTTKRLSVPGDAEATYAIELLPATGQSSCKTTAPTESMIEQSGRTDRLISNSLDRLLRQLDGKDCRHLQAAELPRLRLFHPAGDL